MTSQEPPPTPDDNGPTQGLPSYGSYDPPPPGGTPPPSGGTPPPYGGTQPPVGGSAPFSAGDAIGYGWKKFRENAGPIILATLILIAAYIVLSLIGRAVAGDDMGSTGFSFSLGGFLIQILTSLVGYIVGAALIRGALDVTEGKKFDLAAAFGNLNYGNVIITSLLLAVLETVGFILLIIPGLLVAFFTIFAMYFVVDKDQSPIDAIVSSFNLIRANAGDTLLLILLSIAVVFVGFLALCIGVFVALPVVALAWAYAFKKFLGDPVAA
jgi:uncharacterized membrane protein